MNHQKISAISEKRNLSKGITPCLKMLITGLDLLNTIYKFQLDGVFPEICTSIRIFLYNIPQKQLPKMKAFSNKELELMIHACSREYYQTA